MLLLFFSILIQSSETDICHNQIFVSFLFLLRRNVSSLQRWLKHYILLIWQLFLCVLSLKNPTKVKTSSHSQTCSALCFRCEYYYNCVIDSHFYLKNNNIGDWTVRRSFPITCLFRSPCVWCARLLTFLSSDREKQSNWSISRSIAGCGSACTSQASFLLLTHSSQSAVQHVHTQKKRKGKKKPTIKRPRPVVTPALLPVSSCLWLRRTLPNEKTVLTHAQTLCVCQCACVSAPFLTTAADGTPPLPTHPLTHTCTTYAHVEAIQIYTQIVQKHTLAAPPWLCRPAMNHGCLHVHPFCLISPSDFTGVCRLQSRMFMAPSCHVFCSPLSYRRIQRRDWLCWKLFLFFLFPLSFPLSFFLKDSGHERKRCSLVSAPWCQCTHFSVFFFFLFFFYYYQAFPVWSVDLLWSWLYPTVSRLADAENRKLNPESPNLRFVSCTSNRNIKGQNTAKQGLS